MACAVMWISQIVAVWSKRNYKSVMKHFQCAELLFSACFEKGSENTGAELVIFLVHSRNFLSVL